METKNPKTIYMASGAVAAIVGATIAMKTKKPAMIALYALVGFVVGAQVSKIIINK